MFPARICNNETGNYEKYVRAAAEIGLKKLERDLFASKALKTSSIWTALLEAEDHTIFVYLMHCANWKKIWKFWDKKICQTFFRIKKANYKLQRGLCEKQILSSESIRNENCAVVI